MNTRMFFSGLLLLLAGVVSACSGGPGGSGAAEEDGSQRPGASGPENEADHLVVGDSAEQLVAALEQAMGSIGDREHPGPAEAQDLLKLMPDHAGGLDLVRIDSRRLDIGPGIADVRAKYGGDPLEISLSFTDVAALAPIVQNMTSWIGNEIDRESSGGFERTRTFQSRSADLPAFESYSYTTDHAECSLMVWVADRFLVSVNASGEAVEVNDCKEVLESVPFRKLERLAHALAAES